LCGSVEWWMPTLQVRLTNLTNQHWAEQDSEYEELNGENNLQPV
jgi:hypothetical protein